MSENIESKTEALNSIDTQLILAKKKHPDFVADLFQAVSILTEECGEVAQAVNDYRWNDDSIEHIKEEVAQVGAVAIRFLELLEELE